MKTMTKKIRQRGFSLIEVLVAMFLMTASLLYLAQLMLVSMHWVNISNDETKLNAAVNDRLEQLKNMNYDSLGSPCLDSSTTCGDLTSNFTDTSVTPNVNYFDDSDPNSDYIVRWTIKTIDESGNPLPANTKRLTLRAISKRIGTTEDTTDATKVVRDLAIYYDKVKF
jgi:prepilin-type N-terminal cleavage/methylation domain-containing protein